MPERHGCLKHWGAPARELMDLLSAQTRAERKAVADGIGKRPRKPYEGWIHRVKSQSDYDCLVKLYFEICLAIKQPTDMPTHWGKSEVKGSKGPDIDASKMGHFARETLKGLETDGNEAEPGKCLPVHSEDEVPRYGTPNWLEKPPKTLDMDSVMLARALLCEFRGALAR